MSNYSVILFAGRKCVICEVQNRGNYVNGLGKIADADFQNTGKALCGILQPGQTLENWLKRR